MQTLLEVNHLVTSFQTERGPVTAVDGLSFSVQKGETLGIVGESGCGKSVTAESILRLLDERLTRYEGDILFNGEDLLKLSPKSMERVRGKDIAMIFQDPMSSLNPVYTVGDQLVEVLRKHLKLSKKAAYQKAVDLISLTGIPSPEKQVERYPFEMSGGIRQRIMIALALACQPKLLIADEPTTALDVTIQAQILDLLQELQETHQMGMILITHDLAVVAETCDRVAVMYLGQVVEETTVEHLFERPLHPYTIGLMKSVPTLEGSRTERLHQIPGTVPSLHEVPLGCRFASRCEFATQQCVEEAPPFIEDTESHKIRCWHYREIEEQGEELHVK